jgi:hypothetical protein
VFYNGKENKDERILRLSDSFPRDEDASKADVDVRVHMFNIRPQYKSGLLDNCKTLSEYSWFVEEIRTNSETMDGEAAVDKAIKDMPEDYEIKAFLMDHLSEVKNMCLTEYNEAETMQMFKEEGREEERVNTERERKRAEAAEKRVAELEALLAKKTSANI